jgi:hypothetical protein
MLPVGNCTACAASPSGATQTLIKPLAWTVGEPVAVGGRAKRAVSVQIVGDLTLFTVRIT